MFQKYYDSYNLLNYLTFSHSHFAVDAIIKTLLFKTFFIKRISIVRILRTPNLVTFGLKHIWLLLWQKLIVFYNYVPKTCILIICLRFCIRLFVGVYHILCSLYFDDTHCLPKVKIQPALLFFSFVHNSWINELKNMKLS